MRAHFNLDSSPQVRQSTNSWKSHLLICKPSCPFESHWNRMNNIIFCYLSLLQMLFKIPKGTANKLLSTCKGSTTAQGPSSSCMLVAQAVLTEMWNSSIWLKVLQFSATAQHSFLTPPHLCTQQANPGQHHKARSRWGCWRRAQHKRIQKSTYAQLCHIFTVEHNC